MTTKIIQSSFVAIVIAALFTAGFGAPAKRQASAEEGLFRDVKSGLKILTKVTEKQLAEALNVHSNLVGAPGTHFTIALTTTCQLYRANSTLIPAINTQATATSPNDVVTSIALVTNELIMDSCVWLSDTIRTNNPRARPLQCNAPSEIERFCSKFNTWEQFSGSFQAAEDYYVGSRIQICTWAVSQGFDSSVIRAINEATGCKI